MRKSGRLALAFAILTLVVLSALARAGDRDVAELLFEKGEKAARKKAYEEAAELFQRAHAEHPPYPEDPEALYELARALERLDRGPDALEA